MLSRVLVLFLAFALISCAPRQATPTIQAAPENARIERIFIATQHGDVGSFRNFGNARQPETRFFQADVSIPPSHVPGQIETSNRPNPQEHFVLTDASELDRDGFLSALLAAPAEQPNVGLFIHGYNTNIVRAGLRVAQLQADFDAPFPLVAFAWPSSGELRGYVYDRDSALFARDGLERLIRRIHARTGRKMVLVAHSMGTLLTMEALRQMEVRGPGDVRRMVDMVVLVAPDIDPDVFRAQVARIGQLPQPFLVLSAQQDNALRLSSLITGTTRRLGTITRSPQLEALGITFVDVTGLGGEDAGLAHTIPFSSPRAMQEIMRQLEGGF
jgi:esterase/lipase superfamily enzyme